MKKILAFLLLIAGAVEADIIETWSCTDIHNSNDILAAANVYKGRKDGSIMVADIEHQTKFRINGFNRRWDFDYYSFIIEPDGTGYYYDFSLSKSGEKVQSSIVMQCEKIEPSYFEKIEIEREREKELEIG